MPKKSDLKKLYFSNRELEMLPLAWPAYFPAAIYNERVTGGMYIYMTRD
jgi:hypothetical protein